MSAAPEGQGTHHEPRQVEAKDFARAIAEDLELFANLHDREPTREVLDAARACPIEDQLALKLQSDPALAALAAFALAVDDLPSVIDQKALDDLAAGFADVYLRHTYRAAPTESVWYNEEGLERQAPMFQVREIYRKHGLAVADWANRPDDHLVLQLRFLAHLFAGAERGEDLAEAAAFLDSHLLQWIKKFAVRLVETGAPNWFAALALLTASYVEELRDHLTDLTGVKRAALRAAATKAQAALDEPSALAYVPGTAPSW